MKKREKRSQSMDERFKEHTVEIANGVCETVEVFQTVEKSADVDKSVIIDKNIDTESDKDEKKLYVETKAAAHKEKRIADIVVKAGSTVLSGVFAGRAIKNMNDLAIVGAVTGCGIVGWMGDCVYEYTIKKPIQIIKNVFIGCLGDKKRFDPNKENDWKQIKNDAIIEKAGSDASAYNYLDIADELKELTGQEVGTVYSDNGVGIRSQNAGYNESNVHGWQISMIITSIATSCIPCAGEGKSELPLKIVGGVVTAGVTAMTNAFPYIAEKVNAKELEKEQKERGIFRVQPPQEKENNNKKQQKVAAQININ